MCDTKLHGICILMTYIRGHNSGSIRHGQKQNSRRTNTHDGHMMPVNFYDCGCYTFKLIIWDTSFERMEGRTKGKTMRASLHAGSSYRSYLNWTGVQFLHCVFVRLDEFLNIFLQNIHLKKKTHNFNQQKWSILSDISIKHKSENKKKHYS